MLDSEYWLCEESSDLDFPLPQCSLLLTFCRSRCALFFFTGKGILLCYSISAEALGRAAVSAHDRRQSQSCSGNLCAVSFMLSFSTLKWGRGDYKVSVGRLSSSFIFYHPPHLCLSSSVSSHSRMLKEPLLKEMVPLLRAEILSGAIVTEMAEING